MTAHTKDGWHLSHLDCPSMPRSEVTQMAMYLAVSSHSRAGTLLYTPRFRLLTLFAKMFATLLTC